MAYIEDILPQIRKGRKARRKGWHPQGYIYLNQSGELKDESNYDWEVASYNDLLPDDWELVPEPKPKKLQSWVKLYDDGSVFGYESLEKSMESVTLAEHNGKAKLVETRMIEWSVE